jgi:hypothetical protein
VYSLWIGLVGHGDQISRSHNWNVVADHHESSYVERWNSGDAALNDGNAEVDQGSRVYSPLEGWEIDGLWGDSRENHSYWKDKGWEWVYDIVGNWGL